MRTVKKFREVQTQAAFAARELRTEVDAITQQIQQCDVRLQAERTEPVPLDEIESRLRDMVARRRERYLNKGNALGYFGRERCLGSPNLEGDPRLPDHFTSFDADCVADPDAAVARGMAIVRAFHVTHGRPSHERAAAIGAAERERAELVAAHASLVDCAIGAGIPLDHLPETVERQAREQRQQQLDREQVADRQAREAALNARHAHRLTRPGQSRVVGHSRSLTDGAAMRQEIARGSHDTM